MHSFPVLKESVGGNLADDPAISDLVVEHDGISPEESLALSAQSRETGEQGADLLRAENRLSRRFVVDLPRRIDGFDDLGGAHREIVIGRNSFQSLRRWPNSECPRS